MDADYPSKGVLFPRRITLDEPFSAFGKERMVNEVHMPQRDLPLRDILDRARDDGCGGRGEGRTADRHRGGSSRPIRKIVLLG